MQACPKNKMAADHDLYSSADADTIVLDETLCSSAPSTPRADNEGLKKFNFDREDSLSGNTPPDNSDPRFGDKGLGDLDAALRESREKHEVLIEAAVLSTAHTSPDFYQTEMSLADKEDPGVPASTHKPVLPVQQSRIEIPRQKMKERRDISFYISTITSDGHAVLVSDCHHILEWPVTMLPLNVKPGDEMDLQISLRRGESVTSSECNDLVQVQSYLGNITGLASDPT